MLSYRLANTQMRNLSTIDLFANECFDLFHTISELALRGYMMQRGIYSNEMQAYHELGHSLEDHVVKAQLTIADQEINKFIKEYKTVSFVRYLGYSNQTALEKSVAATRKAASLQRRILGQQENAQLNALWEYYFKEENYIHLFTDEGFTLASSSFTKRTLVTFQHTLEKIRRDTDTLVKFLSLLLSEDLG